MSILASAMTGIGGERVALCDVAVDAVLHDLLCEVTVGQTYRNDEQVNIEALYTFPLPLDAVLLDLAVEIGGKVLQGVVVGKKEAEEKYEDAVSDGDAAVMLEALEPGLYTMNVGNLLPGEQAKVTFRYALLYRWSGDRIHFFLPTTIAPRYGESPHLPHQAPEVSLTVENRFTLKVEIFGSLRDAQFVCPSHSVTVANSVDSTVISIDEAKTTMDRDFVLNLRAPMAPRGYAWCDTDGEGAAAIASFQPFFRGLQQPRALDIAIVVDCSGSMQGDSIAQAKQALEGMLDGLQPHDRMTLIAFGSTTKVLADRLLPCNPTHLAKGRRFAKQLDSSMGGTEIGQALRTAYTAMSGSNAADVFLVTDGEVSDWQAVVDEAKRSGHRVFTVGVGSAVSEAFVRGLAAATGGECELVSPREGMAERVVRHFERMRSPRARRVEIHWPDGSCDLAPAKLPAVFEGDTVIACARFDHRPTGNAVLKIETESGEVVHQEIAINPGTGPAAPDHLSTIARLAAAMRLPELAEDAGRATAVRYRLVSRYTNWLVVAVRQDEEKTQQIPALRKVPQTLQAGWGGTGSVARQLTRSLAMRAPLQMLHADFDVVSDAFEVRREPSRRERRIDLPEAYARLLQLVADNPSRLSPTSALDLLRDVALVADFDDLFRHADDLGLDVRAIAAIVLARILGGPLGEYVPPNAEPSVASLHDYAEQATHVLGDMRRHAADLLRALEAARARDVLRDDAAGRIGDVLVRLARLDELLDRLRECERRIVDRLDEHRIATKRNEMERARSAQR